MSDSQLQADVQHAFAIEPGLIGTHIVVSVSNGVVELSGRVQTDKQRELAEQAARGVEGVRSVIDNIHL
jgi:hyperosmotically inducible protein